MAEAGRRFEWTNRLPFYRFSTDYNCLGRPAGSRRRGLVRSERAGRRGCVGDLDPEADQGVCPIHGLL